MTRKKVSGGEEYVEGGWRDGGEVTGIGAEAFEAEVELWEQCRTSLR